MNKNTFKKQNEQYRSKIKKAYIDKIAELEKKVSALKKENSELEDIVLNLEEKLRQYSEWNERLLEYIDSEGYPIDYLTSFTTQKEKSSITNEQEKQHKIAEIFMKSVFGEYINFISKV